MRWPLRYQILLPFAGVMLAVVLGVSLLDAYLAARRTQDRIERQLHDVAHTLLEANFPLTEAVLQQTRGLSGAEFVLADEQGRARATTLSMQDRFELRNTPPAAPRFELDDTVEIEQESYFHTAVKVRSQAGGDTPMVLHILYPHRLLQEARWRAAYPPLVVGSLFLGMAILLAVVLAQQAESSDFAAPQAAQPVGAGGLPAGAGSQPQRRVARPGGVGQRVGRPVG